MQHNILIVEDEKGIRDAIKIYLNNQGYNVFEAENGKEGLEVLNREDIHLAIVDIMMPVMDGITMTMRLRETYDIPVIFLSAKSEDIDKITGLNIGADDYVTKPFASMELIARVNSQIRRYDQILNLKHSSIKEEENSNRYVVGGLELDDDTKEVTVDGNKVKLTAKEYQILRLLIKTPGRVYSSEQIYEQVWNEKAINTETIMVHIRKLREKIEVNHKKPHYIKVVWGIGYKMEKM